MFIALDPIKLPPCIKITQRKAVKKIPENQHKENK